MQRVYAFVDGGYVREHCQRIGVNWEKVSARSLAQHSVDQGIRGEWLGDRMALARVYVYDAVADESDSTSSGVEGWLQANDEVIDVHVRRGMVKGKRAKGDKRRQKGVDVQLAVDALTFASNGSYDVALIVTGDGDFAPLVEAIRLKGPLAAVCCFMDHVSPELKRTADRVGYLPEDPGAWNGLELGVTI